MHSSSSSPAIAYLPCLAKLSNSRQSITMDDLVDYSRNYCRQSTVHGFAYLPHQMTNIPAKLFWAAVIVVGVVIASVIVNEVKRRERLWAYSDSLKKLSPGKKNFCVKAEKHA